jgi:hypothetical protein
MVACGTAGVGTAGVGNITAGAGTSENNSNT